MKYKLLIIILILATNSFAQNNNRNIGFKENKGQIIDQKGKPNSDVKYLLNTNGLNVQIKTNGFSYDIYETKKHPLTEKQKAKLRPSVHPENEKEKLPDYSLEYIYHRIDIDFVNSNPKVELIKEEESKDYDNYYNVPNKPDGVLMVHQYQQITYKNIYPNIDVVFSIPKDSLKTVEYNFVVHPKGKISDIQLKFNGAKTELVDNKIKMQVRFGKMEETLPMSWTEDGKCKKEIAVGYKKIKNNVYGFESTENVSNKTVIIDPVPMRLWGTFYGDETNIHYSLLEVSITTDSFGNSYMAGGTTASNSSYSTTGAHQTSIVTNTYPYLTSNGIIVKFDPNGNRLWGTYYGGEGINIIKDIKIDYQNNLVIIGRTPSKTNISTIGAYKPNLTDDDDAFLVKFNNSGVRLWGTYFGGESSDSANALSIDKNNNIYIVGSTSSKTNIAMNSNFQTQINNGYYTIDGFLAKFKFDGNLIWSTYVGGEDRDALETIVVKDNYLITGGYTNSFTNISTIGVFQENHSLVTHDEGVVYKFSLNGQRIWATYYGGEYTDYVYTVETDNDDNIYLGGMTGSKTNMTTPGCFDSSGQTYGGFFAKLDSNGRRIWGSYLGDAIVYSIIFKNNSIYLGATNNSAWSTNLTTPCAYIPNNYNYSQGYIGKFSKQGDIIWGTFVGGWSSNETTKITFDNNNAIFVGGISSRNNGIADSNSYQSSVLGSSNYFLMKFSENSLSQPNTSSNSPICIGKTLELKASGGTNYSWTGPNGFTSTEQNPTILNATAANSGQYSCAITGTSGCDGTVTNIVVAGDIVAPIPDLTTLPAITGDCKTQITTIPTATDTCAGAITATTASPLSYSLPGTYTIVWNYDDGNGNSVTQNQTVIISSQPIPSATSPQTFCTQQNITLNSIAITGQNIKWYDALTNGNLLSTTSLLQNGITYYASQTINGCESERIGVTVIVEDNQVPIPNLTTLPAITGDCTTQITTIPTATDACAGAITATTTSPLSYSLPGTYTIVWKYDDGNGNSASQNQTVIISSQPLPTTTTPQNFCIQQNATLNSIAITGQNIKWYDALTNGNLLANTSLLQNSKTYYASQTINGCESARIPVLINIQNTATPTGNSTQTFCSSQNPTLNTLVITGTTIKWYDNSNAGSILSDTTPLQDGKTYYASQTISGCESQARLAIAVSLISSLPAKNYEELFCDDLNDSTETVDLSSYNSSIISNAATYNFSYYNSLSGAENETASSKITNFSAYQLALGDNKIYVRINSNTPCYAVAELKLALLSKPKITIEDIVPICENNTITIDAGAGFDSYLWSNGATTQSITVSDPGLFSVTVTDDYDTISCSSTKNFTVKISNKPAINSIETKDWSDNDNVITVFTTENGEYEYSIDGINYQDSNVFSGLASGKYTVEVRDKNGCGTAKDEIFLLMYPKFFTPNGDGYNDSWKIKFSDAEDGLTIKIFDRYGKLIKMLSNNSEGWNGTFNGTSLPAADYWFIVTRANGTGYKGHFSLKR